MDFNNGEIYWLTSWNLLFGVFLPRKVITISQKITISFKEVSLKGVLPVVESWNILAKFFKSTSRKVKYLTTVYDT